VEALAALFTIIVGHRFDLIAKLIDHIGSYLFATDGF
jgi:hypothetical protein